jgi:phosphoribosylaminoimidazole synthetase
MSVNDLVVQGAEPLFFLDYYATSRLDVRTAVSVLEGVAAGCRESGCALLGGETAEMPGMYHPGDYDLAGFAVGVVERHLVLPKVCAVGDVILGLPSSGVHSNGFSLVRHLVALHGLDYAGPLPFAPTDPAHRTLADALLAPTRLYVKTCVPLARRGLLVAMAHITGGGLRENIPRFLPDDHAVRLDATTWPLLPVFAWLARLANLSAHELGRTFNCGIGMVLAVRLEHVNTVCDALAAQGERVYRIGVVEPRASPEAPQVVIDHTETAWPLPRA